MKRRDATGEEKQLPIHLTSLLTFSLCYTVSFILSGDQQADLSRLDCSFYPGFKRGGTELLPSRLKEWSYFEVETTGREGATIQTGGIKMVVFISCPESLWAQMKYWVSLICKSIRGYSAVVNMHAQGGVYFL